MSLRARICTLFACLLLAINLCALCGCNQTGGSENESEQSYNGTTFTLGNLSVVAYDQEIVTNTDGRECLAIYLHVTNRGTETQSVMGTYNVSRTQGSGTLKVAVAYDTNGNSIHTAAERIEPGKSADVCMCFVLQNTNPVTITFGNSKRGVSETVLTFPVAAVKQ